MTIGCLGWWGSPPSLPRKIPSSARTPVGAHRTIGENRRAASPLVRSRRSARNPRPHPFSHLDGGRSRTASGNHRCDPTAVPRRRYHLPTGVPVRAGPGAPDHQQGYTDVGRHRTWVPTASPDLDHRPSINTQRRRTNTCQRRVPATPEHPHAAQQLSRRPAATRQRSRRAAALRRPPLAVAAAGSPEACSATTGNRPSV